MTETSFLGTPRRYARGARWSRPGRTNLGANCYIGTNANPLQIDLTTGTSGELTGSAGMLNFNSGFTMVTVTPTLKANDM